VHELASGFSRRARKSEQRCCSEWPEAASVMVLLLGAMRLGVCADAGVSQVQLQHGVQVACCWALYALIQALPSRGRIFLGHRGGEAVLAALSAAHVAGDAGEELLRAATKLTTTLIDGDDQAAQELRRLGALEALAACSLKAPELTAKDVMWAVGKLGGVSAVFETMARASAVPGCSPASSSVVRGGLRALADITWHPSTDCLAVFPQVAPAALNLVRAFNETTVPAEDAAYALKSLGGVLCGLTARVSPGTWQVMDDGVTLLVEAVRPGKDEAMVRAATDSIGRIALESPAWRQPLRCVLELLAGRLRNPSDGDRKLQKYLFWAAAAIAGLPAVLSEMRSQLQSETVQDAAMCAIIDILDDDLDGDYSLSGTEEAAAARQAGHLSETIAVVIEAMRLHRGFAPVANRGAYALGLLHGLLPVGVEVPVEAIDAVMAAFWRHPYDAQVSSGVCSGLRAFLEPRRNHPANSGGVVPSTSVARVAAVLRDRDAGAGLKQVLEGYADDRGQGAEPLPDSEVKLLEDASFALGLIEGIPVVLDVIVGDYEAETPTPAGVLQAGGLKAVFELSRGFPELFPMPVATRAAEVAATFAVREGSCEAAVKRHAELLRGMLSSFASATVIA